MATNKYSGQVAGTKVAIVAGAGHVKLCTLQALNTTGAVAYLQLFELPSGSVTVGTTAPTLSFGIPASGQLSVTFEHGLQLTGTGLTAAGTTTRTGSTGAAIDINLVYD